MRFRRKTMSQLRDMERKWFSLQDTPSLEISLANRSASAALAGELRLGLREFMVGVPKED